MRVPTTCFIVLPSGGRAWVIQVLAVPFAVLCINILGGYIDRVGAVGRLEGGAETCEGIILHIL